MDPSKPPSGLPLVDLDLHLTPDMYAPAQARAALRASLDGAVGPDLRQDVILLVSEVVTNAVRYGAQDALTDIELRISAGAARLHVEVVNTGQTFPKPAPRQAISRSGWGLFLLERLSLDWGVRREESSVVVWFDVGI